MRLIKVFSLAALVAVAAMALATPAPATSTQLCQNHTSLTCSGGTAVVNLALAKGTVGKLLAGIDVLCLGVSSTVIPLGLGSPQSIHTLGLGFSGCGTGSAHSNCSVTVEEPPLFNLLKTGLDEGVLTATNGKTRLVCSNLGLSCVFDLEGAEFSAGAQHLTAEEALMSELGGKFLCPNEGLLDGLLETTKTATEGSLCKVHASICASENLVNEVHMTTTSSPVLLNNVVNIECESSLGGASVLDTMLPQKPIELDFTELAWKGCHPKGSGSSCTVTTKSLPTFNLKRTALNLGEASTVGLQVGFECASLELNCVFGNNVALYFEGALHTGGAGHGMFTASEATLIKLEGGGNCPESVKWDALYELSEHVYLGPYLEGSSTYVLS